MDDEEKAKDLARRLIAMGGSQPGVRAAHRRRPPSYKSMYFDADTGNYSIDAATLDSATD